MYAYKKIGITIHTRCHALISLAPSPSCGPYVCVPSLYTCLYACKSLTRKTVTFYNGEDDTN